MKVVFFMCPKATVNTLSDNNMNDCTLTVQCIKQLPFTLKDEWVFVLQWTTRYVGVPGNGKLGDTLSQHNLIISSA